MHPFVAIIDDLLILEWAANWTDSAGLEIATHWLPMQPKIEHWRLNFQNWSPAGDSCFVR